MRPASLDAGGEARVTVVRPPRADLVAGGPAATGRRDAREARDG